ncbi:MAG: S10 family peptidase [Gammaproteobacteria bacterium]
MKSRVYAATFFAMMLASVPAFAAHHGNHHHAPAAVSAPHAEQSVTQGSVTVEGKRIGYKAIAGLLIIKNDKGQPYTSMSYVAYVKKGVRHQDDRPITFFYNGGPGSSTVWLHMLAFGPQMAVVGNGTLTPPAPYQLVNNDYSLLDATDEVFVDAPGTGYGRIIGKKEGGVGTPKMVWGIDPDAQTFTRFITEYLSKYNRWNSPKFLYGESYGTTRSAVLSYDLEQANVPLNGVILQSSILNFAISVDGSKGNPGINIAYATGLPSYAATAWYHKKLPNQPKDLLPFLKKVEHFAMNDYLLALDQGNLISAADKKQIAETMHQYTGLPVAYILKDDLKVSGGQFAHELLGDEDDITGRLDSRYSGPALDPMGESGSYDPLNSAIDGPTVALFNQYVHNTLDFGKSMVYRPTAYRIIYGRGGWSMKHKQPGSFFGGSGTPNVMPDLADAMKHDPNLKVLLMGGYMDLGTPFFGAEYEMHQLPIPDKLQKNISYSFFPSGHMVYVNPKAHKGLHDAAAKFIENNFKPQK